jgi:two-component system alkaline phosphatase synthesis response regulator PhoP
MVDDDQAILKMYQTAFEHEGFEFNTAQNGMDGIKISFEKHPNLILLDLLLPEMDGISVMKKLRENDWGKTVPIIILTNMDTSDEILNAVVENEPTYYFVKANTEPSGVISKVKEVLGEKNTN